MKYIVLLIALLIANISHAAVTTITNGTLTIGVDSSYGGIVDTLYLNSNGINLMPSPTAGLPGWETVMNIWGSADPALLNTNEPGYSDVDNLYYNLNEECNSHILGPVYSQINATSTTNNILYVNTNPVDWNYNAADTTPSEIGWAIQQGYFEKWISFSLSNTVHIQGKYTYQDSYDHSQGNTTNANNTNYIGAPVASPTSDQADNNIMGCDGSWFQIYSLPLSAAYTAYFTYGGSSPWTNDTTSSSSTFNTAFAATENWIATCTDSTGASCVGIYSPQSSAAYSPSQRCVGVYKGITGSGINPSPNTGIVYSGDSAISPSLGMPFNFTPGAVWNFDMYVAVGTVAQIRQAFYQISGHAAGKVPASFHGPGVAATSHGGVPMVF